MMKKPKVYTCKERLEAINNLYSRLEKEISELDISNYRKREILETMSYIKKWL